MKPAEKGRISPRVRGLLAAFLLLPAGCGGTEATPDPAGPAGSADVIPSERRTTWNPGLTAVGGIPSRTTVYKTLSPSGGDDTSAIQAAINACPANQVVALTSGDFRISGEGLYINRSSITLRGSGPGTRLLKTGWRTTPFPVVILGHRWSSDKFASSVNLGADGAKGSSSITLARVPSPPLAEGEIVLLDQLTNPELTWWGPNAPPGSDARSWSCRTDRPISQMVEVASTSGTTVTFSTPLHIGFLTAYQAQLSRYGPGSVEAATKHSGVENLYLEGGAGSGNITLFKCAYCWVKDVESAHSRGTSVNLDGCFRCEVRDSYIHTSDNPNPGGEGYLLGVNRGSSDNLIENNIVWNGNKVIVMKSSGGGNVIAYNYMEDGYGAGYKTIPEVGLNANHGTTSHMDLFEGNQCWNAATETYWGNAIYITTFRNHLTARRRSVGGLGLTDTADRFAVHVGDHSWWYTFAGNVLGTEGQTLLPGQTAFVYENTGAPGEVPMWHFAIGSEDEATVKARTIRHGNFDYVSNSVVWDPRNPDQVLPASLYLQSKPAFFQSYPWPWVDPTGSTRLHTLPARARFDGLRSSGAR